MDWRDFFPAFKWVPNKSLMDVVYAVEVKRTAIIRSLIREQRKRIQKSQVGVKMLWYGPASQILNLKKTCSSSSVGSEDFTFLLLLPLKSGYDVQTWLNISSELFWHFVHLLPRVESIYHSSYYWPLLIQADFGCTSLQEPPRFYADILLSAATHLTQKQLEQAIWEPIIETSDTTLITTEWIMFELAKNPDCQERLYKEIVDVVGTERMVTEDDLPKLKYLTAVIKETLRKYPPVPLLPSRNVDQDITVGGYNVPKGWQVKQ